MPLVVHSLLRLGLFAAALLGLWFAGMGGWLLVVVAAVVAWALSYLVLGRSRTAAATWLAEREAARRRVPADRSQHDDADAAAEDAEVDADPGPGAESDTAPDPGPGAEPDTAPDPAAPESGAQG